MLETVTGLPDTVVAMRAIGRVTRQDYEDVLLPAVRRALERHRKLRCYYELGSEFAGMDAGAMWEDMKLGLGTLTDWERVAVVTDVDWIRHAVNAFRFLMPGEVRSFANAEAATAKAWLTGD